MKQVEQLRKEAKERRAAQAGRMSAYKRFLRAYFDDDNHSGADIIGSNPDGRPALRLQEFRGDLSTRRGAPNLLAPMIDDIVSMRGIEPTSTVIPESHDDQDLGLAVRRTRALRQQHEQSRMTIQLPEAAFYLACLGDGPMVLDPYLPEEAKREDNPFRPAGVYIRVVHPGNAFPKFLTSTDPSELDDLYCIWEMDKAAAKAAYGFEPREDKVEVIHYYSRKEKHILVGDRHLVGFEHNLGFCPAQWPKNKVTDGREAQADISKATDLHEEMRAMFLVYADSLIMSVYPMIHVHNRDQVAGDQIEVGPGAVVETQGDGSVNILAPAANHQAARQIFETTVDNLMKIVGEAPVRIEGQIDRSNVSARSVSRQQEGMHNRFALANTILGYHLERLNSKILLMLYKIPELAGAEMSTWGVDKDGSYHDVFSGVDMGGWHRNKVKWDAWAGADKHERLVMAIQLLKEGLIGGRRVLEEWGDDDPEGTLEEAKKFIAEHQASMAPPGMGPPGGPPQGMIPGGPSGGPPGGPPGAGGSPTAAADAAVAMTAGAMAPPGMVQPPPGNGASPPMGGGGPPTSMPPFPTVPVAPAQSGMGTPLIVPDVGKIMDEAIEKVKLRGRILARHPVPGGLRVEVSDHRDIGPLKLALQAAAEQLPGHERIEVKVPPWYVALQKQAAERDASS